MAEDVHRASQVDDQYVRDYASGWTADGDDRRDAAASSLEDDHSRLMFDGLERKLESRISLKPAAARIDIRTVVAPR